MSCPQCEKPEIAWFKPYCSQLCKQKGSEKPVAVSFKCRWCQAQKTFMSNTAEAKYQVCDKACYDRYDKNRCTVGAQMMNFLFKNNTHEISQYLSDLDLSQVAQTSKKLTVGAIRGQLGPWYEHDAIHYDSRRGKVIVDKDRMIELAVQSYRTATKLKSDGLPVILYRVYDRQHLTQDEENTQTVAGAVRNDQNVWPVERTAAWIQGAMRGGVTFIAVTDPRGDRNLLGGKDKNSDAVYVRELYQINQTGYNIDVAEDSELPTQLRGRSQTIFKLVAPERSGPMPILPKMSSKMDFNHTWDSSKSSLTVDDQDVDTMAKYVASIFKTAGDRLDVDPY